MRTSTRRARLNEKTREVEAPPPVLAVALEAAAAAPPPLADGLPVAAADGCSGWPEVEGSADDVDGGTTVPAADDDDDDVEATEELAAEDAPMPVALTSPAAAAAVALMNPRLAQNASDKTTCVVQVTFNPPQE